MSVDQKRVWDWCQSYRKKRERTPEFLFSHLTEEVGEAFKEWRRGNFDETVGTKAGVDHPEGLGSELADVVLMIKIIAQECGVDLAAAEERKMISLEERLRHKRETQAIRKSCRKKVKIHG